MTFKHKLSKRLAISWGRVVPLSVGLLVGCTDAPLQQPNFSSTMSLPSTVSDLSVMGTTDRAVTLAFTAIDDGAGAPASYDVRVAAAPIDWGSASIVSQGSCAVPLTGGSVGATLTCTVLGLEPDSTYEFQVVGFRGTLDVDAVFGELSNVARGTTRVTTTAASQPATVADLAVSAIADTTATLAFTEVNDGTGQPASYDVRFAVAPLAWGTAAEVARGTCKPPVYGTTIGTKRSCKVRGLKPVTNYQFQVIAFRDTLDVNAVFGDLSNVASATTLASKPGKVTRLAVVGATDSSVTLSFPEVDDGTGRPASYDIRSATGTISWSTARSAASGTCATPVAGSATIGVTRTCTVRGLTAATAYQFQLVAFRGALNVDAVFGALSNIATGSTLTAASGPAPVASIAIAPGSVSQLAGTTQQFSVVIKDSTGALLTGRPVTWTSSNPAVASVTGGGLESSVAPGAATITAMSEGKSGSAAVTVSAPVVTNPQSVTDLKVASVGTNSVTLSFTEVSNGASQPASYDVRYSLGVLSWGSAIDVSQGSCAAALTGSSIGAARTCMVAGLLPGTSYQFQLVAYRGTLNVDAVFGELSNVASAATTSLISVDSGPVAGPSGEPLFSLVNGDAVVYQDNMDQYTTPHAMDSWPGYSLHPFYPDLYPNNYAVITSAHGVGGKALRLIYDRGNGDRFIWKTNPENISTWYAPSNAAFVVQYWFRISKNGGPGGGPGYGSTAVGMKWVEFWNVGGGARTQFSVTAGNATTGPLWHVNPSSRGQVGFQPVGPYWNQVNNNQWHRVTYLYQPNSSGGATDGVARMWIDGTKIVDVSAAASGVTPPGGTKVWCTLAEVSQLDTPQIGMINLGEYMNGGLGDGVTDLPMALDFDDFMWWKLPARIR